MEKTNELNKFLSYIHMGNEVFRIYYKEAEKINSSELKQLITEIQEQFKKHEEKVTSLIIKYGYDPVDSLTLSGKMGVIMEQLKVVSDNFCIAIDALKAVHMGDVSALKFIHENKKMDNSVIDDLKKIIDDYDVLKDKIKEYIFKYCS